MKKVGGRILVIGDVMLDTYVYGEVNRLSPEAPCPILDCCRSAVYKLGGAANVASQVSQSGFEVSLWGSIGKDNNADLIKQLLHDFNIKHFLIESENTSTTVKTRFLDSRKRQLLRVDTDSSFIPSSEEVDLMVEKLKSEQYDLVIISDYSKGFVSSELASKLLAEANRLEISTIVDIKKGAKEKFFGATVLKGNRKEFVSLFRSLELDPSDSIKINLKRVGEILNIKEVIMTSGEEGIYGFSAEEGFVKSETKEISVSDVTGAGDIVTSFLAMLMLDTSITFHHRIAYSNKAAQKKITQYGTGTVFLEDVISRNKVTTTSFIKSALRDKRIVFTNGCFDIFHSGHASLLNSAKELGDLLIVGLNSDDSIRRLKGEKRPINSFENRADVLSSLSAVDYIVEFDEDTPLRLIHELNPSTLVKGGDYSEENVIGAEYVKGNGGKVIILPLIPNISSSNILKTIGYE